VTFFFCLSRVKACIGQRPALCDTLLPMVALSCGNTAIVPPSSPPTTTLHVSKLSGASRVRHFYQGSSALSHWCLSSLSPTLFRSETAGVSRDSSLVPPWPTATSPRYSNSRTTYLYRRGRTRRSSPSVSVRRRACSLFSVSLMHGFLCQWPGFSPSLLFKF